MTVPSRARAELLLRRRIAVVLDAHGTRHLLPDDEFHCCVDEVARLFEPVNALVNSAGSLVCDPSFEAGGEWENVWRLVT